MLVLLDLSDNKLRSVPDDIFNLPALQELYLNDNYIAHIPESIGNLGATLVRLHLHDNKLSTLPKSLANLGLLQHLCIDNNQFTTVPDVIQHLRALQELDADDNKITMVPDWIGNLVNLLELDLSNNRISQLPQSMHNLRNLQQLYLDKNKLVELPEWIGDLVALEELDLNDNQISQLPQSISNLIHLRDLFLSGNTLVTLPHVLNKLQALEKLGLRNNPLTVTDAQLRKQLELPERVNVLYKTEEQEKVEKELIDAIKNGDEAAVRKVFAAIMAGRILIGPENDEKIDISKIRDAKGNNLLQIVLQSLVDTIATISKKKTGSKKDIAEAIYNAEVLYTKIYMTITQFGGPKVQDMMLTRNKAGQDLVQAAVGRLSPNSFFVQTIREYRFTPKPEGQPAERFRIMRRHIQEHKESEAVEKEQKEQRQRAIHFDNIITLIRPRQYP